MQVITISGKARHGKDTTAAILKAALESAGCRVLITHYADLLKYICRTFFGWNGKKDDQGRALLQYVGTDIIRSSSPDFWAEFIVSVLKLFSNQWDYVLIPDCRFPNEITYLRSAGLTTTHLHVVREHFESPLTKEQQAHPSETALDETVPDFTIKNNGTLEELQKTVSQWLESMAEYRQLTFQGTEGGRYAAQSKN